MKFSHRVLTDKEASQLRKSLNSLEECDRLDLIMMVTFSQKKLEKISKRKIKIKREFELEQIEEMPGAVKFCTGDSCQVSLDD